MTQASTRTRPGTRARRKLGQLRRRWHDSLAFRVTAVTVVGGLLGLTLLGALITNEIRDRIFEERLSQILDDAAVRVSDAQSILAASTATTPSQAQQVANDLVERVQNQGGGVAGAMLTRDTSEPDSVSILEPASPPLMRELITPEMRAAVDQDTGQFWQSVELRLGGESVPGVVVGAPVELPVVGGYEMYIVYALSAEQEMISLVSGVLGVAAAALVLVIVVAVIAFLRWVLRPVRHAASTAERLAAGLLDERMEVRGSDELAVLGQSFNEMADSLQQQIVEMSELSRLQQRFVSDVSHELRTPLTTIHMAAQYLSDASEDFDPAARRSAHLLLTQIERFDAMLADLLEISRFDAGAAVLEVGATDIVALVEGVIETHALLAEASGTEVRLHRPDGPRLAEVDARRIERVVRNLVVNAIEHSEGRPVDVTVAADDRAVAVRVRDHGVGLSAEQAERVFDRFWRGDPARARTTGGTGLGLAIATEDVRLHSGTLEAGGRLGDGASFVMTVPRREGDLLTGSPLAVWDEDTALVGSRPAGESQ